MSFIHTKKRSCIIVRNAGIGLTSADCGQVPNQCTKISFIQGKMLEAICSEITRLKRNYMTNFAPVNYVSEIIPSQRTRELGIEQSFLDKLNLFAQNNPIYFNQIDIMLDGIPCKSYEGDINSYWLSSKKYDTSYQPFYPTWVLSAFALAFISKKLGYTELIDVGSGDGRIAYCAAILGLRSVSMEIDTNLSVLQHNVISTTGVEFEILNVDATDFYYSSLDLSNPVFFISGLPEQGDILAREVITKTRDQYETRVKPGFNFMGTHMLRKYATDCHSWGWGDIIKSYGLNIIGCVTLPTLWTNDQELDTAYVFAQMV